MNRLITKMFENRKISIDSLFEWNQGFHEPLKDSELLVQSLHDYYLQQKLLVIITDFDMDGIASGICSFAGFSELGFRVALFVSDPKDGYGFTKSTIERLHAQFPDASGILTCDVGTSCEEGIQTAVSFGLDVFVTDHHEQTFVIKEATYIINPKRLDETYAHPYICGAHVIYQILEQYAQAYTSTYMQDQIHRLRVFAGIGTISDMMPLYYENRPLIRDMISILKLVDSNGTSFLLDHLQGCEHYKRAFKGLYEVLQMYREMGKIKTFDDITEEFIGYYLAPMFNSVKRMDGDLTIAFRLFFGVSHHDDAYYLYQLNEQRKLDVEQYYPEMLKAIQPYEPYIYFSNARSGILGLLAQKRYQQTGMPCVVLRRDEHFHGSGRSPFWYPFLHRTLDAGFFAGGHDPAFGVGFTDELELKAFYVYIKKDIETTFKTVDPADLEWIPDFVISTDTDGDVGLDLILFAEYLKELNEHRPFGAGFTKPKIRLKFYASDGDFRTLGSAKNHLKITLGYGFEVLLWNQAHTLDEYRNRTEQLSVVGSLSFNEFGGQLKINFTGAWEDLDESIVVSEGVA